MIIKLDTREHDLIARCKHYKEISPIYKDIEIVVDPLPIGDVIISQNGVDLVIVERKSLSDLAASIKDGRYEEQSYRLNGHPSHNHNIIYLVEGNMLTLNQFKDRTDKTTLYSAMFSLNYYKGFSILRSMNLDETALILCNMAYKINKTKDKTAFYSNEIQCEPDSKTPSDYCGVVKKVKKDNINAENIGEIMLSQIPGISSVSAVAIMSQFKTLNNLILSLNENQDCLKGITYTNSKGQTRKIGKNITDNIVLFLSKKE
jgi:ERCC4-type nuclease